MKQVKVFPDYCSSGLWVDGANDDESSFSHVLSETDLIALKYWHHIWEFFIAEGPASEGYIQRWNEDGLRMVAEWNRKQNEFEFIYVKS